MSIKSQLIPIFIENDAIEFVISTLEEHYKSISVDNKDDTYNTGEQHIFVLDFSTALLSNILHSKIAIEWLRNNSETCVDISDRLLNSIYQEKMPPSVMMHVLICLSYIIKSPTLKNYVETPECQFTERISQFVEYFSKKPINSKLAAGEKDVPQVDDENGDIDKRTIMDLCAYMFHPPKDGEAQEEMNSAD